MKKVIIMTIAALTAGIVSAASVDTDIGVYSKYIWRGQVLDDQPVVQGGVTVTHEKGFYANVWGNYSLSDDYGPDGLNEVDYTVGFAGTVDALDYDVGYIYYSFPNTTLPSTGEIYGGVALNNLIVTPSLYVYYDVDEANGFYVIGDLNYGKDLSEALSMEAGVSVAWASANFNQFYYAGSGHTGSSLSDSKLYTGLSYAISESLSLSASLSYSFFPDSVAGAASDATFDGSSDNLYGGVSLAYSF